MTEAIIDLAACRHNLQIAQQASPHSKTIAVIKANGYGHGMVEVAQAMQQADAFAVARLQEAIQLRQAGISHPILLLEGVSRDDELLQVQQQQLDMVVHHESQLALLQQAKGDAITVYLKVDSGMHRLGFALTEIAAVYTRLKALPVVRAIHVMTHLANADDKHDATTLQQLDRFYQAIDGLEVASISIANSAGILGWPQTHADQQRPGIMLYGVSPFVAGRAQEHLLKPVMTLQSRLIAVKNVKKGDAIGYGGTYICEQDKRIGIVAAGYADGYPRHAKTGTPVLVNQQRCGLLGRVSMDMICVDLDNQPHAQINDPVILWGNGLAVEEVAEYADTIAYDLLCGVTPRVHKHYIND